MRREGYSELVYARQLTRRLLLLLPSTMGLFSSRHSRAHKLVRQGESQFVELACQEALPRPVSKELVVEEPQRMPQE